MNNFRSDVVVDKMAAAEGSGGGVATEALTEVTVSKCLSVKLPEVAALAQVCKCNSIFSHYGRHFILFHCSQKLPSRSEGLFELTRQAFKVHQPCLV